MLPFRTNIKIFIIEFVCALLLESVYGFSIKGPVILSQISVSLLPVLFMALIAIKIDNRMIVLRCLYFSSLFTFCFMSYVTSVFDTLPFMFLAIAVTLALFLEPRILNEYLFCSIGVLVLMGVLRKGVLDSTSDMSLYTTYVMMYAFAFVALLFIIYGVEKYKKDMEEKNEMAKDALEAKSNFLANMSHEIRTPMNAIYGMAELLGEKDFSSEDKSYINTIKTSSENLLSIINEILDFSKVDSGKMSLDKEPYDVANILHDVTSIIRFRLRNKNVVLETKISNNIPSILVGDEIRIKQILINLLNNAVKFTNRGSIILDINWEQTSAKEGLLKISVKDTGIGISPENVEKLFVAFGQLDTKKNRNVEGTGLGLAICKRLTSLMNGEIGVKSVLKEGSEFYVTLPQEVSDTSPIEFASEESEAVYINNKPTIPFIAPKAKVLIVDDNKVNLQVANELMKLFGFEATQVESGQEAIDRVEKHLVSYDIIFMDHMMPFMDGIEATTIIRNLDSEYARTVPIVALTANAIKGVAQQFIDAGMNDYISKPIRIEHLSEVLKRWIPINKQFPVGTSMEEINEKEKKIDFSLMTGEEVLECIDGVDTKTGVSNCAGSVGVYLDILRTYATSNLATVLNEYYNKEDLANYGVVVHSIKGASKNIGAHDIADKAYSLERAAKRGDINFIWDNHQELVDEYSALIRLLKQIFFTNITQNW